MSSPSTISRSIWRSITRSRIASRKAPGQSLFAFSGSTRSKDVSPVATLQYAISDKSNVYFTWFRGFKSGGFNGRADSPELTDDLDGERLTSDELGFKSLL